MLTTTLMDVHPTLTLNGHPAAVEPNELMGCYEKIIHEKRLSWTKHFKLERLLGRGGQGAVYLSHLCGADDFTIPVALKVFSPERYQDARNYAEAMQRMGRVAARVAQIQHDHLLDVHNFLDRNRIRLMIMEWVDGYDLSRLLASRMLDRIRNRVSAKRWDYINRVIVTAGPDQPRIKPGIAVAIVRDCLSALAALHREGVIHGDIKPSNIMLKRTGSAKIVDLGSAFFMESPPSYRTCTPTYAAPEFLDNGEITPLADLASLGYVLIEMLAGRKPFEGWSDRRQLLEAKRSLPQRLHEILPEDVVCNELLMRFCRGLISLDPMLRFPSAEIAELHKEGAAGFQRQLVIGDLASEYPNEIRVWIEELRELDDGSDV